MSQDLIDCSQIQIPPVSEKQASLQFWLMSAINFIVGMNFAYIGPFLPDLASKQAGLTYGEIGLTFSSQAIAFIFLSIPIGKMSLKWGRKISTFVSIFAIIISIYSNGSLQFMTFNKYLFFCVALVGRFAQGVGRCLFIIVANSYIEFYWPDNFQKRFAQLEGYNAWGLLVGPVIGSFLNYYFGFAMPLFLYATIVLVLLMILMKQLPDENALGKQNLKDPVSVPYLKLLKSEKITIIMMVGILVLGSRHYQNPFLINHLDTYGVNSNISSIVLTIPAILNLLMFNILPRLQNILPIEFTLSLGLLLNIVGNGIQAPIWAPATTPFPTLFGLVFIGLSMPMQRLPAIPIQKKHLARIMAKTDSQIIGQMASSLFTMQLGFSNLLMPSAGGFIYEWFADDPVTQLPRPEIQVFRITVGIYCFVEILVWILFFLFADGYKGWVQLFTRNPVKSDQIHELDLGLLQKKDSLDSDLTGKDGRKTTISSSAEDVTEPKIYN